uniref:NADH dehydrogenase subunit 6 n=1 Tax=Cacopsylla citrisuga TaxID=1535368 RepID=A0A7M1L8V7_9HEMI|nr:NADH dehydrogenase subunit 6 [Cacopsylla citrisuga]QOQ84943.1 NADH dehydrogenase subunit 6 [Cacopsylla citrisuga]
MMKILLIFSLCNSSVILISSHPISFGVILLMQTMSLALCTRIISESSWIPLTLFLVMVGGLMILFLYITSICSNNKPAIVKLTVYQVISVILVIYFLENFEITIFMNEPLSTKDLPNMEFIKLFLPMNIFSSNFMFLYLLVMLIIMIEILPLNKGPMRKKY